MSDSCIEISNLSKRYSGEPTDSLSAINLEICQGDRFGILGPNGAGKTTLISILCGLNQASGGNVFYWGNPMNEQLAILKDKIGYVPQDFAFYEDLSPKQNLEYFGAMYNLSKSSIKSRTSYLLSVLGLTDHTKRKVKHFSGGMKRRVNLAIGLMHEPEVLFLDEPTVGVDIQSKNAIMNFLSDLNHHGTTIIYTSHHLDEAQEFCRNIALIDNGKNIAAGNTKTLLMDNGVKDLKELLIKLTGEAYRD